MLGAITYSMGLQNEALSHFTTALALDEQYDNQREISHVSCNLGHVYLKRGEYDQAQQHLRRALNLAQRIGDDPISFVIYSNMGELAVGTGDLAEAEHLYKKALTQVERINDQEYMCLWNASLALVQQELGKQDEAMASIVRAITIGRAMHNNPCMGVALVALGNLRLLQAKAQMRFPRIAARLLQHASEDVQRALALPGLQSETRTRGLLVLAHSSLLSGEVRQARSRFEQVIAQAQSYNLLLLEKQARRLLEQIP
jgi:tetratricopeptide (TPR) repeat protein